MKDELKKIETGWKKYFPGVNITNCVVYFIFSLGKQGSCVTFDPSLGPVSGSGSLPSQCSESLSLTSDGEIPGDLQSYGDNDKLGKQPRLATHCVEMNSSFLCQILIA
jgi:hypothetical protein